MAANSEGSAQQSLYGVMNRLRPPPVLSPDGDGVCRSLCALALCTAALVLAGCRTFPAFWKIDPNINSIGFSFVRPVDEIIRFFASLARHHGADTRSTQDPEVDGVIVKTGFVYPALPPGARVEIRCAFELELRSSRSDPGHRVVGRLGWFVWKRGIHERNWELFTDDRWGRSESEYCAKERRDFEVSLRQLEARP